MKTGPHPGLVGVSPGTSLLGSCVASLGKVEVLLSPRMLRRCLSQTNHVTVHRDTQADVPSSRSVFIALRGIESKLDFTYSMKYYIVVKMNEPDMLV